MRRPHCLLLLVALFIAAAAAAAAATAACRGGGRGGGGYLIRRAYPTLRDVGDHIPKGAYHPLADLSHPKLRDLAELAIAEYNSRRSNHLVFQNLVRGHSQQAQGTNYKLVIRVVDSVDNLPLNYEAIVYEDLWGTERELTSFAQVDEN